MKDLIKVLKAGPMLLLQDSGRRGFEEYGVSLSGAADKESYTMYRLCRLHYQRNLTCL